jgi:hypothetical protein
VSEQEPRSGSRWEPEPADNPGPQTHVDELTDAHPRPHASVAVAEGEHPASTSPDVPRAADTPRPSSRRRALAAAVGAGLLLIGGVGGYAIGHATGTGTGTGTARSFGHDRGGFRDGTNGPGAAFGNGSGTGSGSGSTSGAGTGGGNTGASSST